MKTLTIDQYLSDLPEERKEIISAIRNVILEHLPKGFVETISYGMLGYVVPHELYPPGYHCDPKLPLPYMNLASQKNHIAVYHMGLYAEGLQEHVKHEWARLSNKKPDMGKSCLRFKKTADVPLPLIADLAGRNTVEQWIAIYEQEIKR